LIDHPPVSPDLNPIENLWGIIVRNVYKDGRQYKAVNELSSFQGVGRNSEGFAPEAGHVYAEPNF
jgi:hypothetical protein